jgi:hypothetical protein
MTVGEVLSKMSSYEIAEWAGYFHVQYEENEARRAEAGLK